MQTLKTYLVDLLFEFGLHFVEVADFVFLFLKLILEFLVNKKFTRVYYTTKVTPIT